MQRNCKFISIKFSLVPWISQSPKIRRAIIKKLPNFLQVGSWQSTLSEYLDSSISANITFSKAIPGLKYSIVDTNVSQVKNGTYVFSSLVIAQGTLADP